MLRVPFLVGSAFIIMFLGGIYSTQWALEVTRGFGGLNVNNWIAYPQIQTQNADPYARAHRANNGKILLGRSEGLVFTAQIDQNGDRLDIACNYTLKGRVPPALFWTVRTVRADNEQLDLPQNFPSILNSQQVLRDTNGEVSIQLSRNAKSGNWLAIDPSSKFKLQLTLIDTPISNISGIRALEMPKIIKENCS